MPTLKKEQRKRKVAHAVTQVEQASLGTAACCPVWYVTHGLMQLGMCVGMQHVSELKNDNRCRHMDLLTSWHLYAWAASSRSLISITPSSSVHLDPIQDLGPAAVCDPLFEPPLKRDVLERVASDGGAHLSLQRTMVMGPPRKNQAKCRNNM